MRLVSGPTLSDAEVWPISARTLSKVLLLRNDPVLFPHPPLRPLTNLHLSTSSPLRPTTTLWIGNIKLADIYSP